MDFILIPIGSAGDVYPFIGIGLELKNRGHQVTILVSDHFRELIASLALGFASLSKVEDFTSLLDNPKLWSPTRAFEFVVREAFLPLTKPTYDYIAGRYVPGKTMVVASSMAFGARIAQDKLGVPTVTVHLQPSVLPSIYESPHYGGPEWLTRLPRPVKKGLYALVDIATDRIIAPSLNRFRASLRVGRAKKIMRNWIHSPRRAIGLFPDWFAAPQPDWPAQIRLTGFPLYDGTGAQPVPPEVDRFFAAGPPPVIMTLGSAMRHARQKFEISVEACRRLGLRGLLLNQFEDQIPTGLPETVMAIKYAPFSRIFPRAAAVMHHGGIGTTSQSFAAGVPQLAVPFAHDQFDNAVRIGRLGVGERLEASRFSLPRLIEKLELLLKNPAYKERARALQSRLDGPAVIRQTCDLILNAYS